MERDFSEHRTEEKAILEACSSVEFVGDGESAAKFFSSSYTRLALLKLLMEELTLTRFFR